MKSRPVRLFTALVACLLGATAARGATYFVDFAEGSDENAGTSKQAPFQHCPGQRGLKGSAGKVELAPGDTIVFKGGVRYAGTVSITASGTKAAPIIYDGNTAGGFGTGKAIIDGGTPMTGWKPCASAAEAGGNPHWRRIFSCVLPRSRTGEWNRLNLCDEERALPLAQDPNPSDPIFQENPEDYYKAAGTLTLDCPARIYAEAGTHVNRERPLILMTSPGRGSAVVDPIPGAAISIEPPQPITAHAFGIMPQPQYAPVKGVAFLADGKKVLEAELEANQKSIQRFDLPEPVTFRKLTVRFLSMQDGETRSWSAIATIAAFDAEGRNQLTYPTRSTMADPKVLTMRDAHYFDGAYLAIHAGRNMIHTQSILEYVPAEHRLYVEFFGGRQYKETRYAFFNSVRFIDQPGEYAAVSADDGKHWTVFCMPTRIEDGRPAGITRASRSKGFELSGASHVVLRGFRIQGQGAERSAAAVSGRGKAEGLLVQDCEVTMVAGVGITTTETDDVTVDRCFIHHNPGHTKGVLLRNARRQSVQNCTLVKNTSTALGFYTCHDSRFANNTVLDHRGMHANGITAYVGCTGLLVEGNRVFGGNAAFTCQNAEDVLIRNNIFGGGGRSCAVGLWTGSLKDVRILNNVLANGPRNVSWSAGFFTNCTKASGWVFKNNIIDGLAGSIPDDTTFSNNIYTFTGPVHRDSEDGARKARPLGPGERVVEDLAAIFVDPARRDFRLEAGSPAIDAGVDLGAAVPTDIEGTKRPRGKGWDLGAYESR